MAAAAAANGQLKFLKKSAGAEVAVPTFALKVTETDFLLEIRIV